MDILCFIDSLNSGGAQRQMVNLALLLKNNGHRITFVIYHKSDFYEHILAAAGIRPMNIEGSNKLITFFKVMLFLKSYKGDYVISFLDMPNFISSTAMICGKKKKWKLIVSERSAREDSFNGLKNRFMKHITKKADYVVCNSKNAAKIWEKNYPGIQDKLRVIYNPVVINEDIIQTDKRAKEDGIIRIMIVSSYQSNKNPCRVIAAIRELSDEDKKKIYIDWYGRIAVTQGNTEEYEKAKKLVCEYGLDSIIHLHGETKEIYKKMSESDAVGLFSLVEGLPDVICEGMMLGKPILMSKVSDYEVLVDGNGFICNPENVSSISDCFRKFIRLSSEERQLMGKRSSEMGRNLFSIDCIMHQWESILS